MQEVYKIDIDKFKREWLDNDTKNIESVIAIKGEPDNYYGDHDYDVYVNYKGTYCYKLWSHNELTYAGIKNMQEKE